MVIVTVAISDAQFRVGVLGSAGVLVLGITAVRFCGLSLPDKPDGPELPIAAAVQRPSTNAQAAVEQANATPGVYMDFLARDASQAGIRTPTYDEMTRKFPDRIDQVRQVLEVGEAPVDKAGLRLAAAHQGDALVLEIENTTKSDLAYLIVTEPTPNFGGCTSVEPLPHNAIVIAKGEKETRVECAWRPNIAIAVARVETIELAPMSAWYLAQVPPAQLAIDPRVARGHRVPKTRERCISQSSQAVLDGLDNGKISWRDLVDFYARHRCQTYPFPASYRALTRDKERAIPAT